MIGVRRCAVADEFGNRIGSAAQCVIERLDDKNACTFTHHETVAVPVEGTRGFGRLIVEVRRERACGCKSAEADAVDAGFRAAADRDIRCPNGSCVPHR